MRPSPGIDDRGFDILIRQARLGDLDSLESLENATFATRAASRRCLRHAMRSPTMTALVAIASRDRDAILAGSATIEWRRLSTTARLATLAVMPGMAGQGLGNLLLEAAETRALAQGCERLRLEAQTDNLPAIRLYERRGYRRFRIKPDYYGDGKAAICFEKGLAGSAGQGG